MPGRLDYRGDDELWDGAHNPAGAEWLVERLPSKEWVVMASILADKDAEQMLRTLRRAGDTFVATSSSNPRALPAGLLADLARPLFARVEEDDDSAAARDLALALGRPVLVTGSLYLLADLVARFGDVPCGNQARG